MAGINRTELWRELEATNESFVRQKYVTGGYGPAKGKLVTQWIKMKEAERQAERAVAEAKAAQATAFWTKVGAISATAGIFVIFIFDHLLKDFR